VTLNVTTAFDRGHLAGGQTALGGLTPEKIKYLFERTDLETPFLTLSRGEIGRQYDLLKAALPRVDIHYTVKPNIHDVIISEVYNRGGNYDVCSAGEIDTVLKTGINPAALIHSHPVKSIPEFDYAVSRGLETFVIDNPEEVKKLSRYPKGRVKVIIRFRIETKSVAVVNLQYKYGCSVDEVLPLARAIKETGQEYYGLCFHVGSQCLYSDNYVAATKAAAGLIRALDDAGFKTHLLDIGGGFPIEYTEPVPAIGDFCAPIRRAVDEHISQDIRVISEPGRFIAGGPVTLCAGVVGKAVRDGRVWYYLDDGLYSTFSGMLFDHCNYPVVTSRKGNEKLSVLAGPTCDSFDVMYDGIILPEMQVGDRILFGATGAYCSVSGSSFNALRRPDYHVID
jgi:ornithine decarboxylase